jgi:SanA protein
VRLLVGTAVVAALAVVLCGLMIGVAWLAERQQRQEAAAFMTDDVARVPASEVGLVLGTSPMVMRWSTRTVLPNRTFNLRLDAAAELWHAGKAKYLLVSGNRTGSYDEPTAMRDGLIERGVPAGAIYRDFAGFRTLDSILRARSIFGQRSLVIVSQGFHVARALFLARAAGIRAWGFEAATARSWLGWRERLVIAGSALLAYYDVWRGTPAREGGAPIVIGVDPAS